MAQKSQVIDLRKSYIPGDPNAIHENLVSTNREDGEEQAIPIVPFEGYNFLPTAYGYRSYFGIGSNLDFSALTSRVQHVLVFQLVTLKVRFIALAEDGIWVSNDTQGWDHVVTHTYNSNVFEEWTYCLIENVFYMYKAGQTVVYKTNTDINLELEILNFVPTFLTMTGQRGIFKAGTRLGFWDSMNSVSWSSSFDLTDFTPSLETLAGNCIFNSLIGKIVTVKSHGEGFVMYATKSIIGAVLNLQGSMIWEGKDVLSNTGISHPLSVCSGAGDAEHYAYTSNGIIQVGGYSGLQGKYDVKFMFPEVYDFLREERNPVLLTMIHKRFLCFTLFDDRYITGLASFENVGIDPLQTHLTLADGYWDGDITVLPTQLDGNMLRTILEQWAIGNQPSTIYDDTCWE